MKKFLLFVAATVLTVSAQAQVNSSLVVSSRQFESALNVAPLAPKQLAAKREEAKGTPQWYTLEAYVYSYWGTYYTTGFADQVSIDGNDVYFKTLFPNTFPELWTKGTLNEAGDEITIPMESVGTCTYRGTVFDLVPCELIISEDGNTVEGTKPLVMKKDGEHIYMEDDVEAPTRYLALGAFYEGSYASMFDYELCLDMKPVEQELEQVVVPETATKIQYTYKYKDSNGGSEASLGNVAIDGNDLYFDYLTQGYGWVKGTRDGNTVSIPAGQFVSADKGYFLFFGCCRNFGMDPDTYELTFDEADNFTLTVDGSSYRQTDEEDTPSLMKINGSLYDYTFDFDIEKYEDLKPAIPTDPLYVYIIDDYVEDYGLYYLYGSVPNFDEDGKYIDPEKMELSIWADDEIMTLSPDDGYYISEDITWMPFGWTDENGGHQLVYTSTTPYFFIYEALFWKLGMQVRYTVDGVTKYSNIVYCDLEGNETTEEVDHETGEPAGIMTVSANTNANVNANTYNMLGQRVSKNAKGMIITAGKKVLK